MTDLLLPSNFNELYIVVTIATLWNFEFIFPYIVLTDNLKSYFNGFYLDASTHSMCQISVSKNKVRLEIVDDGTIRVFYR